MSKCIREVRGCARHTKECTCCVEKSFTSGDHCVVASSLSSDRVTCTLFFTPSQKICVDEKTRVTLSRRLTKLLRHEAARRGLPIGSDGYVCVSSILALPEYRQFSMSDVLYIVKYDDKGRYSVRVDDSVASNTRRPNSNRRDNVMNNCTNSVAEQLNPLFEEDLRPMPEISPPSEGRFLLTTVGRNDEEHLQASKNNALAEMPTSKDVCFGYGNDLRNKLGNEDAVDPAFVLYSQSDCMCATDDTRPTRCLRHSTGSNSTSRQGDCCKTESAYCCLHRVTESCGKRAPAAASVNVCNFDSRQEIAGVGFCSGERLCSGYVDASQISIRAVQGHSLSSVDSDKLLRRVSTLADLVGSVTLPIIQTRAPTVFSSPRRVPFSCSVCQRQAISSPAGATERAEVAAPVSRGGICVVHGTYWRCWKSIRKTGLCRMSRNHIHFATHLPGEGEVISGIRSNAEVFIYLDVERTLAAGLRLYVSKNGVVLSPGNEEGIIECKFFEKVVDRKTGKRLVINGDKEYAAADGAGRK